MTKNKFNWREFLLLLVGGIAGVIAVIPYSLALQAQKVEELPVPLEVLIPIQLVQNSVLIAIAVGLGLFFARRTGLGAPLIEGWLAGEDIGRRLKGIIVISLILGSVATLIVIVLDIVVFVPQMPGSLTETPQPSAWKGFLAAFYGGITEELFMRLGLFSFIAWLPVKIRRNTPGLPGRTTLWITNILVALIFGLGHLPAVAARAPLSTMVVVRTITLNGIAGIAFGYLYWTRGLEAAMIAHFTADIMLHAIIPVFS